MYIHQEERIKKVIAWRICSIFLTLLLTWIYTGSFEEASLFTVLLHVILVISHYFFEVLWDLREKKYNNW